MQRGSSVVVGDAGAGERTARHLRPLDGVTVVHHATVDAAVSALSVDDAGCVVLCDVASASALADTLDALDTDRVPVVLFLDREGSLSLADALSARVADVVRHAPEPTDAEYRLLARRIETAMANRDAAVDPAGATGGTIPDSGADLLERLERLHGIAARLEPMDAEADMYAHMVDHVNEVLPLSACAIGEVDVGAIRPLAARASATRSWSGLSPR